MIDRTVVGVPWRMYYTLHTSDKWKSWKISWLDIESSMHVGNAFLVSNQLGSPDFFSQFRQRRYVSVACTLRRTDSFRGNNTRTREDSCYFRETMRTRCSFLNSSVNTWKEIRAVRTEGALCSLMLCWKFSWKERCSRILLAIHLSLF